MVSPVIQDISKIPRDFTPTLTLYQHYKVIFGESCAIGELSQLYSRTGRPRSVTSECNKSQVQKNGREHCFVLERK
jgi:hypothetical protein